MRRHGVKIKNNIHELRLNKGYTMRDLAKLLNVSPQAVCSWEKGMSNPKQELVLKLCDVFGVPTDEVVRSERDEAVDEVTRSESAATDPRTAAWRKTGRKGITGRSPLDGYFEPLITVDTLKEFIDRKDYVLYEIVDGKGVVRVPVSEPIPEEYLDYKVVHMYPDHCVVHEEIAPRYYMNPKTGEREIYHTHHKRLK